MKKRIGMICRMDNSGLGTLSWEFARHLKPDKVLLVEHDKHSNFPERYKDFDVQVINRHHPAKIEWLLEDIDILFSIETFYDWGFIQKARNKGVKSVLYTMFEMSPKRFPLMPDVLLCPSKLDYDTFKNYTTRVEYLPVPVATDKLLWTRRDEARTFIHSASHTGIDFRKGTKLLLDAIPHVKSNVKFKIFTWQDVFKSDDKRVEIKLVNFKNYWQLWREGDVLVYPQDYNGICLPIIEAMACGLGVITTDIYPFNEYMPKELLFKPKNFYKTSASFNLIEVEAADIDPKSIAEKIDEYANKKISKFSEYGQDWAKRNSWDILLKDYEQLFENI